MATIRQAWQHDEHGFFIADLIDHDSDTPGVLFTETPIPEGLLWPRFYQGEWVNGNAVPEVITRAWGHDELGYFTEDLIDYDQTQYGPTYFTYVPCPNGVYSRPRFNLHSRSWEGEAPRSAQDQLQDAKNLKIAAIDQHRAARMTAGVPFDFDGAFDVVQTRDLRDELNVAACHALAMQLMAAGAADTPLEFRAESDTSYTITPAQMIELGNAVFAAKAAIYKESWELKDAVKNALSLDDINAISIPH